VFWSGWGGFGGFCDPRLVDLWATSGFGAWDWPCFLRMADILAEGRGRPDPVVGGCAGHCLRLVWRYDFVVGC